jgi:hypothetical protein
MIAPNLSTRKVQSQDRRKLRRHRRSALAHRAELPRLRAARGYRYPLAEVTGCVPENIEGGAFKCRQNIQDLAERL